jgi:hypothetical protein
MFGCDYAYYHTFKQASSYIINNFQKINSGI